MKVRFIYIAIGVVVCGALGGFLGAAQEAGAASWVITALIAAVFASLMSVSIGTRIFRRRTERRELTARPDSLERHLAVEAQSKTFLDMVLLTVITGYLFIIFPTQTNPAWVLIGLAVVLIVDFWVRHAVITKAATRATA